MKILAIVPYLYNISPGQRYRIEQWEPILRQHGVEITFVPFENHDLNRRIYQPGQYGRKARAVLQASGRRLKIPHIAREFDAIYLYREAALLGPAWLEKLIARQNIPIVYDFDDAIYLPAVSEANRALGWLKSPAKVAQICRLSTHVMVGNKYLESWAQQWNASISVVPSTIDTTAYDYARFGPSARENKVGAPVIGWSGSTTTIAYLETIGPALAKLAQEEDYLFRFIGPCNWQWPGVKVENVRWKASSEAEDLSALDIGLMPLPDAPFTRGKCAMKALQYMALGIPAVCSPVGVNSDIIRDGENGFLASSEDEWVQVLARLLRDAKLRQSIGEAGHETVLQEFTAETQAPRVLEIFRNVVK